MRKALLSSLVLVLAATAPGAAAAPEPQTDEQKTLYALGLAISRNLGSFNLTPQELEFVNAGLTDGVLHKEPKVDLAAYGPKIQALQSSRVAVLAAAEKKVGDDFVAKAAAQPGATKTASGMVITTVKAGEGETPKPTDKVKVHYTGTLIDGTVFDSSVERHEPATFALGSVIKCWTEGLQLMKVGGKSKLVCPAALAYGDRGAPPKIKPGATLLFDVELLEIVKQ